MSNHEIEEGARIDEEMENLIMSGTLDPEDEGTEFGRKVRAEQRRRGVIR